MATLVAVVEVLEIVEEIPLKPAMPSNEFTVDIEFPFVTNPVEPETKPVANAVLYPETPWLFFSAAT